jgi:hypothetical protein
MEQQYILSRHIINPEFILNEGSGSINYVQFCELINRWKILLVERYNAQPGKKVVIEFITPNAMYYAAHFAAFELGLIVIAEWPRAYEEEDVLAPRMIMHSRIDFAIVTYGQTIPTDKNFRYWDYRRTTTNVDFVITDCEFENYTSVDPINAQAIATSILATPEMDASWGASGGTTGAASQTRNSHIKLFLQSYRHISLLNIQPTDHCLHIQNLLYGAGLWYYFLPTVMAAREHSVCLYENNTQEISATIKDRQINKVQFNNLAQILNFIDETALIDHNLEISSLFVVPQNYVNKIKSKNINTVRMVFGDTTIGGTFFIKLIDCNTIESMYEKNCLGPQVDNFIELKVEDGLLWAAIPCLTQPWKTTNDRFEIRDGNYYFYGRGNQYYIHHELITLGDIDAEVERLFGASATIVIDDREQKVCLAIWRDNPSAEAELNQYFENNFKKIRINQVARGLDSSRYLASRKIDREKIRDYFRYYHLKPI